MFEGKKADGLYRLSSAFIGFLIGFHRLFDRLSSAF